MGACNAALNSFISSFNAFVHTLLPGKNILYFHLLINYNKKMVRHVRHVHMHTGTDCYEWLTKTCKWGVDVDERTLRKDKRKTYLCQ